MYTAAFHTLGCKVNQYETEIMQRQFEDAGFMIVSDREPADVYVVNSCTVTGEGDKKSKQLLRRLRRNHPDAVIVLTGCFPQAFPEEAAALTEADLITGARERTKLIDRLLPLLEQKKQGLAPEPLVSIPPHERSECFEPMMADKLSDHTRAFVKIEDGCDRWCSYCIIPKARGPIRSKSLDAIKIELAALAENGYREVVLVGINLSSYGKETGRLRLAEAVQTACSVPGIERVRLGSLEPELLTDADLDILSGLEKFCPQFHLSLQSGCETVLKRMNRHYTPEEYRQLVQRVRKRFAARPGGASITTDVMVGFPGETEEEFRESLAFCSEIGFAKAHVFAYSVRKGTRAAEMPEQVSSRTKEERSRRLIAEMERCRIDFWKKQCGTIQNVLFETRRPDGMYTGYTMNYLPVIVPSSRDLRGEIFSVKIESCDETEDACRATVVSE